jgi:uncharacterized membrane protein
VAVLLILGAELFHSATFSARRLNTVFGSTTRPGCCSASRVPLAPNSCSPAARGQRDAADVAALQQACSTRSAFCSIRLALRFRTEGLTRPGTLDGTLFELTENRDEYRAIDWLRQRADPGERIIEANGTYRRRAAPPRRFLLTGSRVRRVPASQPCSASWAMSCSRPR